MPQPKPVVVPPPPPPPKPAPTPPTLANLLSGAVALLKLDAYYAITLMKDNMWLLGTGTLFDCMLDYTDTI